MLKIHDYLLIYLSPDSGFTVELRFTTTRSNAVLFHKQSRRSGR